MRRLRLNFVLALLSLLPFLLVSPSGAQTEQALTNPPPVGQPLVREGTLAISLQQAYQTGTAEGEAEAETELGGLGIMPRNGWIADYPVTPDILYELEQSIRTAADAGKLAMGRKQALETFDRITADLGLTIRPATESDTYGTAPPSEQNYPNPAIVNNYYYTEGPPVVTYYNPPPDYYYLYAWVPFPFWCTGFWFPGFFVLHDFHRVIHVDGRVAFVSNHFNDVRIHRVFRVDPVTRYRGRTYAGIGVRGRRGFISTGVPRSERRIFNAPRSRRPAGTGVPSVTRRAPAGPVPRAARPVATPRGGMTAPAQVRRGLAPPPPPRQGRGTGIVPHGEGIGTPGGGGIGVPPSGAGGGAGGGGFGGRRR